MTLQGKVDRVASSRRRGLFDRVAQDAVFSRMKLIEQGELTVVDEDERHVFGTPGSEPSATITIADPAFYRYIATRGAIGGGEAYMDGLFRADDLSTVIRIMARNRKQIDHLDGKSGLLWRQLLRLVHFARRNHRAGSRRNIAEHYDLGNEFFELFLDPTLTYSCGLFEYTGVSMEQASIAKYERLCRKLEISKNDHVLEIGTGWGGSRSTRPATTAVGSRPPPSRRSSTTWLGSESEWPASRTGSSSCSRTIATSAAPTTSWCPSR